jgi:DNA-directed RNA polymerase specialized sigma24 family protein
MYEARAKVPKAEEISEGAFGRFLTWLDDGVGTEGVSYVEMRKRLLSYFDRKNCRSPDELADETLSRVARRLEEEGQIKTESPAKYCYTVGRYVFLEDLRNRENRNVSLDDNNARSKAVAVVDPDLADEKELKEKMLSCLEKCVAKLDPPNREMIIRYYYGVEREKIENRRSIAASLNISVNALSIRACRVRNKLEACVNECATG